MPVTQRRTQSNGFSAELAAPAIITSAHPRRTTWAASSTASRPETSAWWMVLFGPRASCTIETCEAIMFGSTLRKPSGKLRDSPSVPQRRKSNVWSTMQPRYVAALSSMALQMRSAPRITPQRSGSTAPDVRPASRQAMAAAATPSWASRHITLRLLRLAMWALGSKSRTSAAICTGRAEGSNRLIRPTPLRPRHSASQNASRPMPIGLKTPRPVTTTWLAWLGSDLE